jgi:hypothetical protein
LLIRAYGFPFTGFVFTGFTGFGLAGDALAFGFGVGFGGGDIEDNEVCDFAGDDFGPVLVDFGLGAGFGGGVIAACDIAGCGFGLAAFAFAVICLGGGDMSVID